MPPSIATHDQNKASLSGFSLVELAVALSIVAMIAAASLSIMLTNDYDNKRLSTERRMERITEALNAFVLNNQRLPCPADGTLAVSHANFGVEGTPSSAGCASANASSANMRLGVVPVTTLLLPDELMFDAWNRRITYVVDYYFANNTSTNANCSSNRCFRNSSTGTLSIQDNTAVERPNMGAIYLILSHGENGSGAYARNGGASTIVGITPSGHTTVKEAENNDNDATFADRTFAQIPSGEFFDDILMYGNKDSILASLGYPLYDASCALIKNGPASVCQGAANIDSCTQFFLTTAQRCMPD